MGAPFSYADIDERDALCRGNCASESTGGSLENVTPETPHMFGPFAHRRAHPTSIKPVLVVDD